MSRCVIAGKSIGVEESALPETDEDEFYWKDLIGLAVEDQAGTRARARCRGTDGDRR